MLTKTIESLSATDADPNGLLSEASTRLAVAKAQEAILGRRLREGEALGDELRNENSRLRVALDVGKVAVVAKIRELERDKVCFL